MTHRIIDLSHLRVPAGVCPNCFCKIEGTPPGLRPFVLCPWCGLALRAEPDGRFHAATDAEIAARYCEHQLRAIGKKQREIFAEGAERARRN